MSNIKLVSRWYNSYDLEQLLEILCVGDVLEFKNPRQSQRTWGVCVVSTVFAQVARHVRRPGTRYGAEIQVDSLTAIVGNKKVRINNSADHWKMPRTAAYIAAITFKAAKDKDGHDRADLLLNDSKHFAIWCRNGSRDTEETDELLNEFAESSLGQGLMTAGAVASGFSYFTQSWDSERQTSSRRTSTRSLQTTDTWDNVTGALVVGGALVGAAALIGMAFASSNDRKN